MQVPELLRNAFANRLILPLGDTARLLGTHSQVDAVSGCGRLDHRLASPSGFTSAMAMAPPTSIMTPDMKKPVLNPLSGVVALSITLPMIRCKQAG